MANSRRSCSFGFTVGSLGDRKLLTEMLDHASEVHGNDEFSSHHFDERVTNLLRDEGWGWTHVWVEELKLVCHHDDEWVNVEAMGEVLSGFLKTIESPEAIKIMWSDTCDAPRPDHFGGGRYRGDQEHRLVD